MKELSITFAGGARSVTGANFLIEANDGARVARLLIDCGLTQGGRFCESSNGEAFPYDPKTIGAIFFTHAHADHIGLFPRLAREGFRGEAYATTPTRALMPIMLEDSVGLIEREAKECGAKAPYERDDVERAVALVSPLDYRHTKSIGHFTVTLYNAGHILGSALILVEAFGKRLLFTGDLGRMPALIIPDREVPKGPIDYLVTESVYGNRAHEPVQESETRLLAALKRISQKKGTLLIPSFSLERTQIILETIDRFIGGGHIAPLPVFLDSPLAIKVTEVYKNNPQFLRQTLQERLERGDDPFSFPSLHIAYSRDDARAVDEAQPPKVIIAGAGMSHGGRIRSHEARYLPGGENELLLTGYQVPGSLGRRLRDGARTVVINKKKVKVRAKISNTGGFSAHADRNDLLNFAHEVSPRKVFIVLGEMESASFLAQRISGFLGIETYIPQKWERIALDLDNEDRP